MSVDSGAVLRISLGARLELMIVETDDLIAALARDRETDEILDGLATTLSRDGFDGPTITLLAAIAESRWPHLAGWPPSEAQVAGEMQAKAKVTPHSYQRVQGKPGDFTCKTCGTDRNHPVHG